MTILSESFSEFLKTSKLLRSFSLYVLMIALTLSGSVLSGCGYGIRGSKKDYLEKEGIRRIYVAPVVNDSYRYGIENVVYNTLIRSLTSFGGIDLVSDPSEADAILAGRVNLANSRVNTPNSAAALNPSNLAPERFGSLQVATSYVAELTCSFSLIRRNPRVGEKATVWASQFSRSKTYPASNQLGVLGTTSPLINDSEFDRTILDISQNMMLDVRESMIARF